MAERFQTKNWHVVAVIVVCILALVVSGLIQYHYAQKIKEIRKSQADIYLSLGMIHLSLADVYTEIDDLQKENKRLAGNLNSLYTAVTPTYELPMYALIEAVKEVGQ